MSLLGEALAHGAVTIVNAIATGKGSALSIGLWTKARVELVENGDFQVEIVSDPNENPALAVKSVEAVLERFGLKGKFGARIRTESNIPIARGLKSSSVAANAIVLAALAALNRSLEPLEAVKLGVKAAIEAGVTITGAFDDASASYLGGITVTDNLSQRLLRHEKAAEGLEAVILVPKVKSYTATSEVEKVKLMAPLVEIAFQQALKGEYWKAMTLNGLIYSAAYGYEVSPALEALKAGALAAGLSGKGPALAAITREEQADRVVEALQAFEGEILRAKVNNEQAKILRLGEA
ncbi:MAG: shikimate kinase [Candidatus Hecatellaceae archaeon]